MRSIKTLILPALAAALALGAVSPAMAWGTPMRADTIRQQINELQRDVNRNDNRDRISEREAAGLRRDVAGLQNQFRAFNRDGLSGGEMRILGNRIQNIRSRLHDERRDADGRRDRHRDHHRM
jgi:septal ring factor EnvC (AmiA/AmiB activator)